MLRPLLALLLASVAALAAEPNRALVFSKTAGFRRKDSIPLGNALLAQQFKAQGLEVEITEDASVFTAENLAKVRVVAFMSTTGDVMGDVLPKDASKEAKAANAKVAEARRAAFQAWMENGGAFVGVHAASDAGAADKYWPWFANMVGGLFNGHPAEQVAILRPLVKDHPANAHLGAEVEAQGRVVLLPQSRRGQRGAPRDRREVLRSAEGQGDGRPSPDDLVQGRRQGLACSTPRSATPRKSFSEPDFIKHVDGGVKWVLRK
jgi:hypothetical protein